MEDVKTCAREKFRLVTQLPLGQARVWAAPRHRVDRARSATPLAALAKPSFGAERVPKQELGHEEQTASSTAKSARRCRATGSAFSCDLSDQWREAFSAA